MKIENLSTPSFLLDLDQMDRNIEMVQKLCNDKGKELWPMVKTHKSSQIVKKQIKAGARGFLVGTLDEAEVLAGKGVKKISYPYPVMGDANLDRLVEINKNTQLYIAIDSKGQLAPLNRKLEENQMKIRALIIVDSGLGRFGLEPEGVVALADEILNYENIILSGISTHPGHVYSSKNMEDVKRCGEEERRALEVSKDKLSQAGYKLEMVASGSTPTIFSVVHDENINVFRPGNYVFFDNIQMAMGLVKEESCALTVLASVVSNPKEGLFLIDAGSKCLGLDKGAHGVSLIEGFGYIKGHPELVISDLSEEVGKIKLKSKTDIRIGDKIEIIPNHSCSAANCTDYLIGYRGDKIEEIIDIDMRGGSLRRHPDLDLEK